MLKFIPGVLLLQLITIALVLIAPADLSNWSWLRLAAPILIVGFLTAFWFGSIAATQRKDEINRLKEDHAKERENIRVNAERAKTRLVKQTHKKAMQEVRRSSRQSNIRVGLGFAAAAGLGSLLLLTQFVSVGLLVLTTAGGGLGGYLLRLRQEKGRLQLPRRGQPEPGVIDVTPGKTKQLPPGRDSHVDGGKVKNR
jgi:Flp pilus assembly protein TadB